MTERNRRVAIILAVVCGAGLLVCVVCGAIGVFQAREWGEQVAAEAEVTLDEADAFARTHDQIGCRDEGLRRSALCGPTDMSCMAQLPVFTDTCLARCTPTPGFCDGVPPQTEIMQSAQWATAQCASFGRPGDQRCTSLMQSVQRTCARR